MKSDDCSSLLLKYFLYNYQQLSQCRSDPEYLLPGPEGINKLPSYKNWGHSSCVVACPTGLAAEQLWFLLWLSHFYRDQAGLGHLGGDKTHPVTGCLQQAGQVYRQVSACAGAPLRTPQSAWDLPSDKLSGVWHSPWQVPQLQLSISSSDYNVDSQ